MCIMWRRGFYQLAPLLDYLTDILLDVVTDDTSSISIERFGQLNATYVQSNSDLSYDTYATLRYSGQYLPVSHLSFFLCLFSMIHLFLPCAGHISHCWGCCVLHGVCRQSHKHICRVLCQNTHELTLWRICQHHLHLPSKPSFSQLSPTCPWTLFCIEDHRSSPRDIAFKLSAVHMTVLSTLNIFPM